MIERIHYNGLCVGGPMGGKLHSELGNRFSVAALSTLRDQPFLTVPNFDEAAQVATRSISYKHIELFGQGFWVTMERDEEWLIQELAETYWQYNDLAK